MSSTKMSSEATTRIHERGTMEMKLEVLVVPVSDVGRARVTL